MREIAGIIVVSLVGVFVLGAIIFVPLSFLDSYSCTRLQEETVLKTKYDFWTGCLVKVNDRYVPKKNWIEVYRQDEIKAEQR